MLDNLTMRHMAQIDEFFDSIKSSIDTYESQKSLPWIKLDPLRRLEIRTSAIREYFAPSSLRRCVRESPINKHVESRKFNLERVMDFDALQMARSKRNMRLLIGALNEKSGGSNGILTHKLIPELRFDTSIHDYVKTLILSVMDGDPESVEKYDTRTSWNLKIARSFYQLYQDLDVFEFDPRYEEQDQPSDENPYTIDQLLELGFPTEFITLDSSSDKTAALEAFNAAADSFNSKLKARDGKDAKTIRRELLKSSKDVLLNDIRGLIHLLVNLHCIGENLETELTRIRNFDVDNFINTGDIPKMD